LPLARAIISHHPVALTPPTHPTHPTHPTP
jgi:Leucine-rich repeat (LRR) protein